MHVKVHKFKSIDLDYPYDNIPENHYAWSRIYEYNLVRSLIEKYKKSSELTIHNTSWGFEGVHIWFKQQLETTYGTKNVTNSDYKHSLLENTTTWDITTKPNEEWLNKFDFVINVSTLEEIDFNHIEIFKNLLNMVKVGGFLICTFDIPGLDVKNFGELFCTKYINNPHCINGVNSALKNENCAHLNCGYFIIEKIA